MPLLKDGLCNAISYHFSWDHFMQQATQKPLQGNMAGVFQICRVGVFLVFSMEEEGG